MLFTKAALLLVSLAPALVSAQLGVTHVLSNDGTIEYPCEAAAVAEVYYQDKCEFILHVHRRHTSALSRLAATGPLETMDGQKLHKVEVSVDYVSTKDDYRLSMKCL
jgi:hypothetical protein